RARERIGAPLADQLRRHIEASEPALAWGTVYLTHSDLGHRNVIVAKAGERWRVNGVIDWETATTGAPFADIGSLFRYGERHDATFRANFEHGYRDAGGDLPDNWYLMARLLNVLELVAVLDEEQDMQAVYDDCRVLVKKLVAKLGA